MSKRNIQTPRYNKQSASKLFLVIVSWLLVILLFPKETKAGLIFKAPSSIGLISGLVGYWSFDGPDMAGTRAYNSFARGDAYDGLLTGTVRAIGKIGQALNFRSSSDIVKAGNDATTYTAVNNLTSFTYSAWIYPRAYGAGVSAHIIDKNPGLNEKIFTITNEDPVNKGYEAIRFEVARASVTAQAYSATSSIKLNQWYHVVGTYTSAGGPRIYINGSEGPYAGGYPIIGSGAESNESGEVITIGNEPGGSRPFTGLIDEVRIYNRALNENEIRRLYKMGATLKINQPRYTGSLTDGLVGYWSFDGPDMAATSTGSAALDRSGSNNIGYLINNPQRTIGKIGQALKFDGVSSYVDAGNPSSLTDITVKTISAWIKPQFPSSKVGKIVSKGAPFSNNRGWDLYVASDLSVEYDQKFSNGTAGWFTPANSITNGAWQHVVVVYDNSSATNDAKIYLNGINMASASQSTGTRISDASDSFQIGNNTGYTNVDFPGQIDEVRIYNRALSADEIRRLYRIGGTIKINQSINTDTLKNGLVGYWSFDGPDMAGTVAYDRSGQSNNGTLASGPTRAIGKIGQALSFDGVDDEIQISDPANGSLDFGTGDFSYSLWFNSQNIPSGGPYQILAKFGSASGVYELQINNSPAGTLAAHWENNADKSQLFSLALISPNRWYHVVAVRSSGMAYLYLNNILQGSIASSQDVSNVEALGLGSQISGGDPEQFPGLIDEVRIYNRALTPDEIRRLYLMGR